MALDLPFFSLFRQIFSFSKYIVIILLVIFTQNCAYINTHLVLTSSYKDRKFHNANVLILLTSLPTIKKENNILEKLSFDKPVKAYLDKFNKLMPELLYTYTSIDSAVIKVDADFPFYESKLYKLPNAENVIIYKPTTEALYDKSKSSEYCLIIQELYISSSRLRKASGTGMINLGQGESGPSVPQLAGMHLINIGIFSLWKIENSELIGYGKFTNTIPMNDFDSSDIWLESFLKLISECFSGTPFK